VQLYVHHGVYTIYVVGQTTLKFFVVALFLPILLVFLYYVSSLLHSFEKI